MSKKRTNTYSLVVDASVALGAGALSGKDPRVVRCREFLSALRGVCHRLTWSDAIQEEWNRHQSVFASRWLVSMMNLRKLRSTPDAPSEALRAAIQAHSDPNVVALMLKDAHLVEAAMETDWRVASLDERVRGHLRKLTGKFGLLRGIIWVNPDLEEDKAIEWIEDGAPSDRSRRLRP
jgi:hypothetical protein